MLNTRPGWKGVTANVPRNGDIPTGNDNNYCARDEFARKKSFQLDVPRVIFLVGLHGPKKNKSNTSKQHLEL